MPPATRWACSATESSAPAIPTEPAASSPTSATEHPAPARGPRPPHPPGHAMGRRRDGVVGTGDPDRDSGVIAYFGDGATSQGDVNEAFIRASGLNAPGGASPHDHAW